MSRLAIIDADSVSYIIAYNSQNIDIDNPNAVAAMVNNMIDDIIKAVQADSYIGFLGGSGMTFRHLATVRGLFDGEESDKLYKGNRGPKRPHWYQRFGGVINSQLFHKWNFRLCNFVEADDAVSIMAHMCREAGVDYVICGNDKDLHQIPGKHYNYKTQTQLEITQADADKLKYTQLLMGDTTDNITGIPGVGSKTAAKILNNHPASHYKYVVLKEYIKYYGERVGILKYAENTNLIFMLENRSQLPSHAEVDFDVIKVKNYGVFD